MIMKTTGKRSKNVKTVEEYLKKYDPFQPVMIGFSIPDAYNCAKSQHKSINQLTKAELKQFVIG